MDKREWATVQDGFRKAKCGENLLVGRVLWRVYSKNVLGYYKPVLIKKSDSEETKCFHVYEEWLFSFCQLYHTFFVKCLFLHVHTV